MSQDRRQQHRSDADLIEISDALTAMTETRGWKILMELADEKRKAVLEALAVVDPANIGQVARLQAQAHEAMALPRMVQEAIHRGQQARQRSLKVVRGGESDG